MSFQLAPLQAPITHIIRLYNFVLKPYRTFIFFHCDNEIKSKTKKPKTKNQKPKTKTKNQKPKTKTKNQKPKPKIKTKNQKP